MDPTYNKLIEIRKEIFQNSSRNRFEIVRYYSGTPIENNVIELIRAKVEDLCKEIIKACKSGNLLQAS